MPSVGGNNVPQPDTVLARQSRVTPPTPAADYPVLSPDADRPVLASVSDAGEEDAGSTR